MILIWVVGDTTSRLGPKAFLVPDDDDEGVNEPNSDSEDEELPTGIVRMSRLDYPDASSAAARAQTTRNPGSLLPSKKMPQVRISVSLCTRK